MFHYPNGKKYTKVAKLKNNNHPTVNFGNRGMTLEKDLNTTNEYYLQIGKAVIHKKPTPIQIVNVDYPKRSAAVITEAYFKTAATTDYNGIYRGKYIDFEAKETRNKTSFPLNNFHSHQIEHMKNVTAQGGICFVILKFVDSDSIFILEGKHLFKYWDDHLADGRKSIPLAFIENHAERVPVRYQPRIDYLTIIDKIYFD